MVTGVSLIPVRPFTDTDLPLPDSMSAPLTAYVSGPENCVLDAIYRSLLIEDSLCQSQFNPLVLYGPTGVGKSHLALGFADAWRQQHPTARACITTARDWAQGYAWALRNEQVAAWRDAQREFELFVIEDIAQMHKRVGAQRELSVLLDDFLALDIRCVVTSRANPLAMAELTSELSSRLTSGLTVPIRHPGSVARQQIVAEIAKQRDCELTDEATSLLAATGGNTFSDIRRTLLSCYLHQPKKQRFSVSDIRRSLSEHSASVKLPLSVISSAVARYFGVTNKQIVSSSRRQAITRARGIAIYLCRELTDSPLKQIGQHFGNRDHTTVIHAHRITEQRIRTESDVQTAIDDLKALLRSRR